MEKFGNEMTEQAVFRMIRKMLADQFDVEAEMIDEDTSIRNDLGADNLDILDLMMNIEDEYVVMIPNGELECLLTVGEFVHYIVTQAKSSI